MRSSPRCLLCICDSQDSGAALFREGRLVAAVNEERLNRIKLWGGFPALSVREVLRIGGVGPEEVDEVACGTRVTPNVLARIFRDRHQQLRRASGQFGTLLDAFIAWQVAGRTLGWPLWMEEQVARGVLARELRALGIRAPLGMVDHHLAHAAGAWATSPFERALVVTVDGLGDGLSVTVSVGERGRFLRRVHQESGFSDLTLYYSRLTEFLGFRPIRDEGKVNALAACASPEATLPIARTLLRMRDGRFGVRNPLLARGPDSPPWSRLRTFSREEVAAGFQDHLETTMRDYLRHWLARTGCRHVALAGGLFANVKLNQRIATMPEVEEVWVYPHMGDGGLAAGGGFARLRSDPAPVPDLFWGPGCDAETVERAIRDSGLPARRLEDPGLEMARLLAKGRVIARCAGRMEFGPRALGNRSILVQATDPDTIRWLNTRLRRSPFMPFAPVVHEEQAPACFADLPKALHAARFMTVSLDATPEFRRLCPGAVHVDGTARPQVVGESRHPVYARALREYHRLTGLPAVINTSFNMHEEPIVATPEDALEAFRQARLDALFLEDWLVEPPEGGWPGD